MTAKVDDVGSAMLSWYVKSFRFTLNPIIVVGATESAAVVAGAAKDKYLSKVYLRH